MLLHDFRQVYQNYYSQRFLSPSFKVPHLLSFRLYSPMFSGCQKDPVLRNPSFKDSASHVFNIFQSFHQCSTKLFTFFESGSLWYDIHTQKLLNSQCFWLYMLNQVCFRICNSEVLFFVLACYCLQPISQ